MKRKIKAWGIISSETHQILEAHIFGDVALNRRKNVYKYQANLSVIPIEISYEVNMLEQRGKKL